MATLQEMTDDHLDQLIAAGQGDQMAVVERERRHALVLRQRVESLAAVQSKLQNSVDRLAKPHWIIWATFVAGAIAAIAALILLFRAP